MKTFSKLEEWLTPAGVPVSVSVAPAPSIAASSDLAGFRLRLELARLRLLKGFDELLCLDGLTGVEHLPHQIETVRRVLRYFRGRVLLADEVGLGKTIEACLLLREYLLRGLARRVLILTPASLVSQWREELSVKFGLNFAVPSGVDVRSRPEYWSQNDRVLTSIALAKGKNFEAVTGAAWDLVIVDEAHHCKNRSTMNWKLVNALKRRQLFLLTATPVQNNLMELYNLLTLLEPGHLKTEADFKKTYIQRGNPLDPRNRERLRTLLGEVMIRNTRSLVSIDLPPRYAQTFVVKPGSDEAYLYRLVDDYLRRSRPPVMTMEDAEAPSLDNPHEGLDAEVEQPPPSGLGNRRRITSLLLAAGSHPKTLASMLERLTIDQPEIRPIVDMARKIGRSVKEEKLLELLRQGASGANKTLIFANFRLTLRLLQTLLTENGVSFTIFSGEMSAAEKDMAVAEFKERVPVMLCSESGGEGRNLQFANTLINFDLPWNPMRIEQRVGRIHRIGQTRETLIFNLCVAGSMEERILRLLNDKIRMFELVVGEVGSILGALTGGEEFESLAMNLWLRSRDEADLDAAFDQLGNDIVTARKEYLKTKELDKALFGEDYE